MEWLKNLFKKDEPPFNIRYEYPKPKPPAQPISCIAQKIIDDLNEDNYREWIMEYHWEEKKASCCFYTYKHNKRNYTLEFERYYNSYSVSGIDMIFNRTEEDIFGNKIRKIYALQDRDKVLKQEKQRQAKLKKLFPDCFEK